MVTEEQRKRMEENRAAALARRHAKSTEARCLNLDEPTLAVPPPSEFFRLSHKHYLAEAERRFPQPRTDHGSWKMAPCINKHQIGIDKIATDATPTKCIDVSLELVSSTEFAVVTSDQHAGRDLLNRFLSSVNPQSRGGFEIVERSPVSVVYDICNYEIVFQALKRLHGVILHQIPQTTLKIIQRISQVKCTHRQWNPFMPHHITESMVDEILHKLPCHLKAALLPFQLEGVKYGLRRGGRCLIADDMGVGKTIQAIAMASCYAHEGSILIVCPASLRLMWAEELERWLPSLMPTDVHLVFGRRNNLLEHVTTPKVVVISYTMLRRLRKSMLLRKWAMLIVDESHNLRCTKQKVECEETSAVLDIVQNIKRVVLLSGTPSLSRPFDIFHQANLLSPGLLGKSKYEFAQNYCCVQSTQDRQRIWHKDFSKGQRLHELNVLLKETIMVRRLKEDVLLQLPPKRRQVIRLDLSAIDLMQVRNSLVEDHTNANDVSCSCGFYSQGHCDCDEEGRNESECDAPLQVKSKGSISPFTLSNQEIGVAKMSGFREWLLNHPIFLSFDKNVSDIYNKPQKMIIFGHHIKVLDSIQKIVHAKGLQYVRIDGSTITSDRQRAVEMFRIKDEVTIAIIGLTAGGVGLDFSSAQSVVFTELPKSSSELIQAEDRAHRRGQNCAVNIYIFCAKDTSDEMHWQSLSKSLERVSMVTNGVDNAIYGIEVEAVLKASLLQECDSEKFIHDMKEIKVEKSFSIPEEEGLNMGADISRLESTVSEFKQAVAQMKSCISNAQKVCPGDECSISRNSDIPHDKVVSNRYDVDKAPPEQLCTNADNDSYSDITSASLMFEVSANTGRIHLYIRSKLDGYRPTPLEENFLPEDLGILKDSSVSLKRALPNCLTKIPENYECAISFIHEWNALRPIHQNYLFGRPLQGPLAVELECVKSEFPYVDGGLVKGGSKRRVLPTNEVNTLLPEGATWRKVVLYRHSILKERHVLQAWSCNEEPLCKLCHSLCLSSTAKVPEYFEDLFCKKECYQQFRTRTSRAYLRHELYVLEKGICTICKLDCHALVQKIEPLDLEERRQYILQKAPEFKQHKCLLERLVSDAKEGNAWHADHIVPVFQGGGECSLENLRTLCVICHAKTTAKQTQKRRLSFAKAKNGFQATIEKYIEKWCEKRLRSCMPQEGVRKLPVEKDLSDSESDNDLLGIEICGSVYSGNSDAKCGLSTSEKTQEANQNTSL